MFSQQIYHYIPVTVQSSICCIVVLNVKINTVTKMT